MNLIEAISNKEVMRKCMEEAAVEQEKLLEEAENIKEEE